MSTSPMVPQSSPFKHPDPICTIHHVLSHTGDTCAPNTLFSTAHAWCSLIMNAVKNIIEAILRTYLWDVSKACSADSFIRSAFISTYSDWHEKQFLKEDKNGAHCIVTAVNKNQLRQSHCVTVGRLVRASFLSLYSSLSVPLSLLTKETDTPPTRPSVDFSHSPLVLLKILANWCCQTCKHGGWLLKSFHANCYLKKKKFSEKHNILL